MDRVINIKIVGNYISKDNKNAGVKGEANVTKLRISFDADWNKYSKKITFWNAKGLNPVVISLTTNLLADVVGDTSVYLVPIPTEPLSEAGLMTFVIDGFLNDKRQRSMSDTLVVSDAPIDDRATQPVEPTPSQIDQFQAQLETILNDIHDAVEAKEDIQNMSVSSEELATGEKAFVEKTEREGVVNLHFGLPAGNKGDKGDKGTSAVHIGKEAPTDPDITVWVYTYTDEEANEYGSFVNKSILKIKNENGEWVNVATNVANDAIEKCEDAAKSANEAADTLNLSAEEIRSGGFVEALKEINDGRKFTFWIGTHNEYEEDLANGVNFTDTFCVFEDDTTEEDIKQSIETLQENVKGLQETSETLGGSVERLKEDSKTLGEDVEEKASRYFTEETIWGQDTDEEFLNEINRIYKAMPENSIRYIVVNASKSCQPFYGGNAHLTIRKVTGDYGTIHAYLYLGYTALEYTRCLYGGKWYNWKFVNPPCYVGVEYRTTELWNGNVVWTKVIDCGKLPNNSAKYIDTKISNLSQIIRKSAVTNNGLSLPYRTNAITFDADRTAASGAEIYLATNGDYTNHYVSARLWYTKKTND